MTTARILLSGFIGLLIISCKGEPSEAEITMPVVHEDIPLAADKYVADTVRSVINWKGSKPTGSHSGTINLSSGKIYITKDSVETGRFTINMESITVKDPAGGEDKENLENHLKGLKEGKEDHFFNTQKYPRGTFEITDITKEGNASIINGNLTLKDITKSIKFPADVAVYADSLIIKSEKFTINRTLWNINFSSKSIFENLGDKYIDDEIELQIAVKALREK